MLCYDSCFWHSFLSPKNYFIKFIPINCEIKINYKINEENKNVISQQNIYYYNSDTESEKINKFTITTENNECLIYTYLEEQIEDFYSVLLYCMVLTQ